MAQEASLVGDSQEFGGTIDFDYMSVVKSAFQLYNWRLEVLFEDAHYLKVRIENGANQLVCHCCVYALSDGGRDLNSEKRIQISPNSNLAIFDDYTGRNEIGLVLGVYGNTTYDDKVICAFPPIESQPNSQASNSKQIKVQTISAALQNGYARQKKRGTSYYAIAFRPEFLHFYLHLGVSQHYKEKIINNETLVVDLAKTSTKKSDVAIPQNLIVYGAPGTGKSYYLMKKISESFEGEPTISRITFHPNTTYYSFVGNFKPISLFIASDDAEIFEADTITLREELNGKEPIVSYEFEPGHFLRIITQAYENPDQQHILIIEEINRANVAAVFGDFFQLLDRDSTGKSIYYNTPSQEIISYLNRFGVESKELRLPQNLFLWATMNSADQGVFPLDSAFKRRWTFEYISLNLNSSVVSERVIKFGTNSNLELKWDDFRLTLNKVLTEHKVSEDKQIGPFFMNEQELLDPESVKNKLIMYLREDVFRHNPEKFFTAFTFSQIINNYDSNGRVFISEELNRLVIPE